jgi:hypothetical protein
VNGWFSAKDDLAKVDVSSFEKGRSAFKSGDREKLISSINSLEAQEQKLRDRWAQVEQTRSVMLNPNTRAASLRKEDDSFFSGTNMLFKSSSGGSKIAEETEKLNEVKRAIKDSANQVYARRVKLQYDLRRMDASVPVETGAPQKTRVFEEDKKKNGSFLKFESVFSKNKDVDDAEGL